MSSALIISILVIFYCLFFSAQSSDVPEFKFLNITRKYKQHFTTNEHLKLKLRFSDLDKEAFGENCEGICSVNKSSIQMVSCQVDFDEKQSMFINVFTKDEVTKKDNGIWKCELKLLKWTDNDTTEFKQSYSFKLHVKVQESPIVLDWTYITAGIGVLVLLVFTGQTICIIHFRRKAKAIRRQAEWTSKRESNEDTVRYSKMPVQKSKENQSEATNESGIYEALDNIRVAAAPQPPPLKTLPRKNFSQNSSPVLLEPPAADGSSLPRSLTNEIQLWPFTSSLQRKTKIQPKETKSKRTTLDRIKERPPLPIPSEELYEVMENTPPPLRREVKKKEVPIKEVQTKEEFRGFSTQPRRKPLPAPGIIANGTQSLKPGQLPSLLKEAIEQRKRMNTTPQGPSWKKEIPSPRDDGKPGFMGSKPSLPPPDALPSRQALTTLKPEKSIVNSPVVQKRKPPPPVKPKQLHPLPSTPCKPAPPFKPKQLHPLPSTPSKPESSHVVVQREDDNDDSDEDWTYEPLPKYNIYSM